MTFDQFFKNATRSAAHPEGDSPYNYQCRLACGEQDGQQENEWLSSGVPCESKLINIPTGLGKTAGVVLAWLWNRVINPESEWPRRLVYCLPMRTLVEQTRDNVGKWLRNLGDLEWDRQPDSHQGKVGLHILMGGEQRDTDWDAFPEENAILIGTQDMLLSRALNRGYGVSRYRWPMHFGLLNTDGLWVMDEVQLMGSGLWTTAQLDWMRRDRFSTYFPTISWWMSATLGESFFDTQDRQSSGLAVPDRFSLAADEESRLSVLQARRPIEVVAKPRLPKGVQRTVRFTSKGSKPDRVDEFFDALGYQIQEEHVPRTLSMIVCNRVDYAQRLYGFIEAHGRDEEQRTILLTSRFRPQDSREILDLVLAFEEARKRGEEHPGLILVSTQVVEAGFDVSAARLWSELAPWPSTLQRMGRLNRDGKLDEKARAFVFKVPAPRGETGPYEEADLKESATIVDALANLCADSPEAPIRQLLQRLQSDTKFGRRVAAALQPKPQPFPRALDLHGLFSTEPDLFGGFTDVSSWVRNSDANADVTVFWRAFDPKEKNSSNTDNGPGYRREEGCLVPVFRLRDILSGERRAWQWNSSRSSWEQINSGDIRPGMTLMLPASFGGYDTARGWTGVKRDFLIDVPPPGCFDKRDVGDRLSQTDNVWVTLGTHLGDTANQAAALALNLGMEPLDRHCLRRAAELHDIGKSLRKWQESIPCAPPRGGKLWAKFGGRSDFRPGFRHEVASALAMWHRFYRDGEADFPALAIYLVAAHHGKARTTLGSLPGVEAENVCGIPVEGPPVLPWNAGWRMDFEAARDGAAGVFDEESGTFTLESPGWTGLVADLLGGWEAEAPVRSCGAVPHDQPAALGPFKLAYLECLLRACDGRASAAPSQAIPSVLQLQSQV